MFRGIIHNHVVLRMVACIRDNIEINNWQFLAALITLHSNRLVQISNSSRLYLKTKVQLSWYFP